MKRALLLLAVLPLVGCGTTKAKNRSIFCVGVCVSTDTDVDKKKGEEPALPAPVPKQD